MTSRLFGVTCACLVSAALPPGLEIQRETDQAAVDTILKSPTPIMKMMQICGLPIEREELEKFARHSWESLARDGPNFSKVIYRAMKDYSSGLAKYLPSGLGAFGDIPTFPVPSHRYAAPNRPHDINKRLCNYPSLKGLHYINVRFPRVIGSYDVKSIGDTYADALALDTEPRDSQGRYGQLGSFSLVDKQYDIISFIPDLLVSLVLVRKALPKSGYTYGLELWRGQDDRVKICAQVRHKDYRQFRLMMSADRTHFYVVYMAGKGVYRVMIGSTEPYSQLEDSQYRSTERPLIDGDLLEVDGKLINLASYWKVGKVDNPLPEDFLLRHSAPDGFPELVDTTKSRLVEVFRHNCMDFGGLIPENRNPRVKLLADICSSLLGSKRNEGRALVLIDQFTQGRRRSDVDVTRMFGEVVEEASPPIETLQLKGKKKRPFDLVEGAPAVLPSNEVASLLLARFDRELAIITHDNESIADLDALAKLFSEE